MLRHDDTWWYMIRHDDTCLNMMIRHDKTSWYLLGHDHLLFAMCQMSKTAVFHWALVNFSFFISKTFSLYIILGINFWEDAYEKEKCKCTFCIHARFKSSNIWIIDSGIK